MYIYINIYTYPYINLVPVLGPSVPVHPTEGNGPSGFFPLSWPLRPGAAGAFGVLPFVPGWVGLGDGHSPFCHWLG